MHQITIQITYDEFQSLLVNILLLIDVAWISHHIWLHWVIRERSCLLSPKKIRPAHTAWSSSSRCPKQIRSVGGGSWSVAKQISSGWVWVSSLGIEQIPSSTSVLPRCVQRVEEASASVWSTSSSGVRSKYLLVRCSSICKKVWCLICPTCCRESRVCRLLSEQIICSCVGEEVRGCPRLARCGSKHLQNEYLQNSQLNVDSINRNKILDASKEFEGNGTIIWQEMKFESQKCKYCHNFIQLMKVKLRLAQRALKRRTSVFQPYEQGYECLMCRPAGCCCRLCIRPEQNYQKQTVNGLANNIYETNFNISVRNAYSFVLMHLQNNDNKNPLGLLIPDICIFNEGVPFNIYYSSNGHIRGYKLTEDQIIRRIQIPKIFKQLSCRSNHSLTSKDLNIARFINNQYMMLSDVDLTQMCFKSRSDPIWPKLEYLYNKITVQSRQPIIRSYSSTTEYPPVIVKLAAESLVGYIDDSQVRQALDQESYLDYCNIKICDLLNYKHNIRVVKAEFSYLRTSQGSYVFINADNLEHSNLTQALKKRQQRLQREMLERNNRILLTPRREQKIKHLQTNPMVKQIENKMDQQFQEQLRQFDFHSSQFSKNQEIKNELAFKKLHPLIDMEYKQLLQSSNFMEMINKILGKQKRRPLFNSKNSKFFSFFKPPAKKHNRPFKSIQKLEGYSTQQKKSYLHHKRRQTTTTDLSMQSRFLYMHTQEDRRSSKG